MFQQKSFKESFDFKSNIDKLYPGCKTDIVRLKSHTQSGKPKLVYKLFKDGQHIVSHRAIELTSSRTGQPYIMVVRDVALDTFDAWGQPVAEKPQMADQSDQGSIVSDLANEQS